MLSLIFATYVLSIFHASLNEYNFTNNKGGFDAFAAHVPFPEEILARAVKSMFFIL